ncbi:MAG: formate dehydrogenase subunit gamma [Pseudomonadota bacterium]
MTPAAKRRHKRIMLWSFVVVVLGSLALPLAGYLAVGVGDVVAADATNARSDFWRAVRHGASGYSAVTGPEAGVLVSDAGQQWRMLREGPIKQYGLWLMGGSLALIVLFFLLRGQLKLEGRVDRSRVLLRWTAFERGLHWFTAILFIILAVTGLSLALGRAFLIPVFGKAGFAAYSEVAMLAHNYLGPFFVLGVLLEIVLWARHNLPNTDDILWFLKGGGFGKSHPHAGRMNGGEKVWFLILCTFGVAVCVTGLILDFPNFGQTREQMQIASLIHAGCAMFWIAVSFGHIYIGSIGTEGALEGMTTGYVTEEWARQHHDRWYEEEAAKGRVLDRDDVEAGAERDDSAPRSV